MVNLDDDDERAMSAGLGDMVEEDDEDEELGSDENWEVFGDTGDEDNIEPVDVEDNPEPVEVEDNPPVPIEIEDQSQPPDTLPSRPTVVLEYMEMGDLNEFRKRMKAAGVNPPNRLLWRVLQCRKLTYISVMVCFCYFGVKAERAPG